MTASLKWQSFNSKTEIMKAAVNALEMGADAVITQRSLKMITLLAEEDIPVMGHLGLTPQSIYKFGTYTVRAKEEEEAEKLLEDALMLERLGCFALVLEKVPAALAEKVAKSISIPVIGIGAGSGVDGQVLVTHDMLGMTHEFHPRFLRRYLDLYSEMTTAFESYISDVKSKDFPSEKEQY